MLRLLRSSKAIKPVLAWLEAHPEGISDGTPDGRRVLRRLGLLTEPELPVHPDFGCRAAQAASARSGCRLCCWTGCG